MGEREEAGGAAGRAEHLHRVDGAVAAAVEDDTAVGARILQRVKSAEAVWVLAEAVRPDGAHHLVEGELVIDLRVAFDGGHPIAPLRHHLHRLRPRAEEHHPGVEPRRPLRPRLVAAVLHRQRARRAVLVPRHVEAVGARQHVGLGDRREQRVPERAGGRAGGRPLRRLACARGIARRNCAPRVARRTAARSTQRRRQTCRRRVPPSAARESPLPSSRRTCGMRPAPSGSRRCRAARGARSCTT